MPSQTLILGLGNILCSDEGIGPVIVERCSERFAGDPAVRCLDGGTLSFTLALPIEECARLIVVDAASLGEHPGRIRCFENADMDRQLRVHARSVHEVSLSDLMDMARLTDTLPHPRALIGIEPATLDWGQRLSTPVETAIPGVLAEIERLLECWHSSSDASGTDDIRRAPGSGNHG